MDLYLNVFKSIIHPNKLSLERKNLFIMVSDIIIPTMGIPIFTNKFSSYLHFLAMESISTLGNKYSLMDLTP